MQGKLPVTIPDILIMIVSLGLTLLSFFAAYIQPNKTARVSIEGLNQKWIFPLDAEETVMVPGPLGETVIRIREKEVWVESSPCANQTCVAMGRVKRGWVACLPNNVFFMVEGSNESANNPDRISW